MQEKNKKQGRTKVTLAKKRERWFVASILFIPIISFLVFWLYVNFDSLLLAFQREEYGANGMQLVFTLDNFKRVFTDFLQEGELLIALRNTFIFFLNGLIVVLPLSILMAYFIYKKIRGFRIFRTITYLPNIITSSALVILFQYTFLAGGPYEAILAEMGKTYENPFVTDSALVMLVVYNIIFGFGTNMVILGGAMNSISAEVLEAGEIDGCNWFQELIYLILPMIWPTISTILVLSVASVLSATGPILAMTQGAYETSTLSFLLYGYATGAVPSLGQDIYYASAIGLVMTLVTFPIVIVLRKLLNRQETY